MKGTGARGGTESWEQVFRLPVRNRAGFFYE
nr:MAG TPA: hypothetical protein [Caudoviricetes sp.]